MSFEVPLVALLIVLVVVAVFLAAAETALIRISRVRVVSLADQGDVAAKRLLRLLDRLPRVLNAILLSALLAQIGSATVLGVLAQQRFGSVGVTVASVGLTAVLFIYAEAIPKTYAVRHTDRVAMAIAVPVLMLETALRPLVSLLVWIADLQMPGKGVATSPTVTEDELRRLASHAAIEGEITGGDLALIERAFKFGDRRTDDIMVPRTEIVSVASDTRLDEALSLALKAGHRRLPVFEGSIENITGVVGVRDLVQVPAERRDLKVGQIASAPLVVPESKRVVDLLAEMQASQTHLAVVVDEYGGTAGLVTVEDIAEELLGTLRSDAVAEDAVSLGGGRWMVRGALPIEDVADLIGEPLPEGEWNTIAGLVLAHLGRVANVDDKVRVGNHVFRVAGVRRRQITRIEISRPAPPTPEDE